MEHTRGPWRVYDSWVSSPHTAGVKDRTIIVLAEDTAEASICFVADVPAQNTRQQERELANARAIAALPCVLAALKALRDNVEKDMSGYWTESTSNFMQQADAALAKVEGE